MSRIVTLKHRITFQSPPFDSSGNPVVTANGFPDMTYTNYATVWAQVVGGTSSRILGKDYMGGDAIQSQNILMITIRYRKDLTPDMRLMYNNKPYAIEVISDKDGMQVWLDLLVKGWQTGGV